MNPSQVMHVPFHRPSLTEDEIAEVVACMKAGWLTTGPRTQQFEYEFANAVGSRYAVAVNSCTAALHLSVEALKLGPGQAVLVPTMTFAATAEIVRYQGAVPLLVDCDPVTLNMDLKDAACKIAALHDGRTPLDPNLEVVGIVPVHIGGLMLDMDAVRAFAKTHKLWVVEDAAHAFPAGYRSGPAGMWRRCGEQTADVTCFSFYANKTITTGEGGMAVTDDESLAARIRSMSLHGLSQDAWKRFNGGSWDYRIMAPGFKYNLTDLASSLGIHQLKRAEALRCRRQQLAMRYRAALSDLAMVELPEQDVDRLHSWHLFPLRLRLDRLTTDRNNFIEMLKERGVSTSVHWRPLHLHPYYASMFQWRPTDLPIATREWQRLVSLPLFPTMTDEELEHVVLAVRDLCDRHSTAKSWRRLAA